MLLKVFGCWSVFCSYFVCSFAAQVSCCYFSSTYGLVTFGTYISNSSSTFYTFHKFQINSRMNNSYDQRYISIDKLLKKITSFIYAFLRTPKITTVTFSIGQSYKIQSKSMRANLQIGSKKYVCECPWNL